MSHFGEHAMIDGYGGDYDRLNDRERVARLLEKLPDRLGMRKLAPPVVYFAPGNDKKDPGGWSGFVVIAESHISVHTFPARGFVSADVYTCKSGLETESIARNFRETFALKETEVHCVKRGIKYPVENIHS